MPSICRWKELFPELTKLIVDKLKVTANGDTMTGMEFRTRCVQALFEMKWQSEMLSNIASMFK